MEIKQLSVINPILKDYIDYYYTLSTKADLKAAQYIAYPSVNTALCFLDKCNIKIFPDHTIVEKDNDSGLKTVVVGRTLEPVHISMPPEIQEFCIVFKPLGLNCIATEKLGKLLYRGLKETNQFDFLKPAVDKILKNGFDVTSLETEIIANIKHTEELNRFRTIVAMTCASDSISFNQLTIKLGIPYKTIYRLFKRHFGISPVQFRAIIKFRTALNKASNPEYKSKMSAVALESGYFDQAHYINEFKKISRLTPKNFISSIWFDDSRKIAWRFQ